MKKITDNGRNKSADCTAEHITGIPDNSCREQDKGMRFKRVRNGNTDGGSRHIAAYRPNGVGQKGNMQLLPYGSQDCSDKQG